MLRAAQHTFLTEPQPVLPFLRLIKSRRHLRNPVPRQIGGQPFPVRVSLCGVRSLQRLILKFGFGAVFVPVMGVPVLQSHHIGLIRIQRFRTVIVMVAQIKIENVGRIRAVQHILKLHLHRARGHTVLKRGCLHHHKLP